jgi:hypothetical protein
MMDERSDICGEWEMTGDATLDGGAHLTAFVCGILAGLSLGLLLAPARGADTRQRIRSAARRRYRQVRRQLRRHTDSTPSVAAFVDRTRTPASGASAEAVG